MDRSRMQHEYFDDGYYNYYGSQMFGGPSYSIPGSIPGGMTNSMPSRSYLSDLTNSIDEDQTEEQRPYSNFV